MSGPYAAAVPVAIGTRQYRVPPGLAADGGCDGGTVPVRRRDATGPIPLDAILLRTESVASSQIENLTASARSIGLAELGDTSKHNAAVIVGNVQAMLRAIDLAGTLTPNAVLQMHRALLQQTDPEAAGRWRTQAVWIGVSSVTRSARTSSPHHDRVPGLVDDLMVYAGRDDQSVLAQAAIAHAQFETIHPFHDGNGRTGRALLHAMLRHHGPTRNVTVPVSAGLLHDISGYHDALTAYRAGDPDVIVRLTVAATFRAINDSRWLAADIGGIRDAWRAMISARRDWAVWAVADLFLSRPVLDAAQAATALEIAPTNVHRHLDRLTEAGVLTRFSLYRRGLGWRADAVLDALDRFAVRAGRRNQV